MKKILIIAIAIAIVAPAMAVQIIGPSPAPSGTIPVMMTIDRYAEIILPDEIILESTDETNLAAPWTNLPGGDSMFIKPNFDCEVAGEIIDDGVVLGHWILDLGTGNDYVVPGALINTDQYDLVQVNIPQGAPLIWSEIPIEVQLTNVDLSSATYSPTAVQVAHVNITVQ